MSVTPLLDFETIDLITNAGGYGVVGALVLIGKELVDDHHYRISLAYDAKKQYTDIGCFTFDLEEMQKISPENGVLESLTYVKHKMVTDSNAKNTSIKIPLKSPYKEAVPIICHIKTPDTVIDTEESIFFGTDKDVGESASYKITQKESTFAVGSTFSATGDSSKPGLKIKAEKIKAKGLTSLTISDHVRFDNIIFGTIPAEGIKCDGVINGEKEEMTVTSSHASTLKISFTKPTSGDGGFEITCKNDITAKKRIPGLPAFVMLFSDTEIIDEGKDNKISQDMPDIPYAVTLAVMDNSTISFCIGVAIITIISSTFAILL